MARDIFSGWWRLVEEPEPVIAEPIHCVAGGYVAWLVDVTGVLRVQYPTGPRDWMEFFFVGLRDPSAGLWASCWHVVHGSALWGIEGGFLLFILF